MPKKPKILKDIDEFALKRIEQATKPQELNVEDFKPKCKKCHGTMERVTPLVELPGPKGIFELHECNICKEREYI